MAGRRVNLTALAAKADAPPEADQIAQDAPKLAAAPEPAVEAEAMAQAPPATPPERKRRAPETRPKAQPGRLRYDELERKEARLRTDQYGRLSEASRRLNRARKGTGERITENTLIRAAIDLLLAREDDVNGTTEAELRKSVGL